MRQGLAKKFGKYIKKIYKIKRRMAMKKIIFIVCIFLLSINIFAKTNVEKQVEKIREEFVKINSEKNYKVEMN